MHSKSDTLALFPKRAIHLAFFLLFVAGILCPVRAQLAYGFLSNDQISGVAPSTNDRSAVVLIHGWNPDGIFEVPDKYADGDWPQLVNALRNRLTSTEWKLFLYHWETDADTGPLFDVDIGENGFYNARTAANNAFFNGDHLAYLLNGLCPDLRKVVFVAHSAGSWAAYRAADKLLKANPYLIVSIVLLDPFIPGVSTSVVTALNTTLMSQLSSHTSADRIYRLENYYAVDASDSDQDWLAVGGNKATSQVFSWRSRDINHRVDFNSSLGFFYDDHGGPIRFYADTITATGGLVPDGLARAPWDFTTVGYYRGLSCEGFLLPRIQIHPQSQVVSSGSPVTLSVTASDSRPMSYQWFKNGLSYSATGSALTLSSVSVSDAGEYVVRVSNSNGQLFSEKAVLSVTATPTPIINGVSPRTLNAKPSGQTQQIIITGENFNSSSRLTFNDGAYPNRVPTFISANELRYDISVGSSATTWSVKVMNGSVESLPYTFFVVSGSTQLTGISITGPAAITENGSGQFSATAYFSDGSSQTVSPSWSENSSATSISSAGLLSAGSVSGDTVVTVSASYTSGGITKSTSANVTIANVGSGGGSQTIHAVVNGTFESGTSPWGPSGYAGVMAGSYPHVGSYYAYLCNDNNVSGSFAQFVPVPAQTTAATLRFYLNIVTEETVASIYDTMTVDLATGSDQYIGTVAEFSNLDKGSNVNGSYVLKSYNILPLLSAYKGQSVYLVFSGTTDSTKKTIFRIDDVDVEFTVSSPVALTGLSIRGSSAIPEGLGDAFYAEAVFSDGTTQTISPNSWSENSSATTISSDGFLYAGQVNADTTVSVTASYTFNGVTKQATKNVTIVDASAPKTFSYVAVSGPGAISENSSGQFIAEAIFSDGTSQTISPTWSENSSATTISSSGLLQAGEVSSDAIVSVSARYTVNGVTQTGIRDVCIQNGITLPTLVSLSITGAGAINGYSAAEYTATAYFSDGSSQIVNPVWSENSSATSISAFGLLSAGSVVSDTGVTVSASYTFEDVTRSASKSVTVRSGTSATFPDLVIRNVNYTPGTYRAGDAFIINASEANQGDANISATEPFVIHFVLSPSTNWNDAAKVVIFEYTEDAGLDIGEVFSGTFPAHPNMPDGNYYLGIKIDANQEIDEGTNETNNIWWSVSNDIVISGQSVRAQVLGSMAWAQIGNPGNPADSAGRGSVGYVYSIGKYEVSVAQFTNAYAAASPISDGDENYWNNGTRILGANAPATYMSWHEAARFCNWLTSGNVSNGAYQLDGSNLVIGVNRPAALNQYGTVYALPTIDEWHKAAYYTGIGYSDYANGTTTPPAVMSDAIYNPLGTPWVVGSGAVEQNGTYDMMGNVNEWTETPGDGAYTNRYKARGGYYSGMTNEMSKSFSRVADPTMSSASYDVRIAVISGLSSGAVTHGGTTVNMELVTIEDAGNSADTNGKGSVGYVYQIGKYEITIGQFMAAYNADNKISNGDENYWNRGSYSLGTNAPATTVTWHEAARFCNWLTSGSASNGAYQLDASGVVTNVNRSLAVSTYGTVYVIPTENEWYKAAYWTGSGYSAYATGTDVAPVVQTAANYNPTDSPWVINSGSQEQNGTFNMMGNVGELSETTWTNSSGTVYGYLMGGWFSESKSRFIRGSTTGGYKTNESSIFGMRLVALERDSAMPRLTSIRIEGSSGLSPYSTNLYTCSAQYTDGSISNVTSLADWSLVGDPHGAIQSGGSLGIGEIPSHTTVMVQAVWGGFTTDYSVLLDVIPSGVLAAWDFYGYIPVPSPITATATVNSLNSAPVLKRIGLGSSGSTNCFIAGQFPTNSTLADAVSAGKYFTFTLSNQTPFTVTNVSMCMKRFGGEFAPTGFTLRVSADAGFGTFVDNHFATTNTTSLWSVNTLCVSGTSVYFRLYGYGVNVATNSAAAGFAGTTNNGTGAINSGLDGTMYDLIIYGQQPDVDLDHDGLPDSWEQQYFGGRTGAVPNTICSNGLNTIREAYLAGLNPHDSEARFGITEHKLGLNGMLRWNAVSGRVYSVYWTTNLLNSFQCLESNIPWTRSSFTNSTTVPRGFYKIDVQLAP